MITARMLLIAASLAVVACASRPPERVRDESSGIEMVRLEPGEFMMGSPETEAGREDQERLHRVRLTRPFLIGITEVTQGQWRRIMGNEPSHFKTCGDDCPVERVSLYDVDEFIRRLNALGRGGFRLPTEAEWEYACRAGGDQPFGHRATLGSADANINGRYPYDAKVTEESAGTLPAGRFAANPWGLVDMSGNVWEWTADPHCPYRGDAIDPVATCDSPHRVIRGGSWKFDANSARCALRYTHRAQDRGYSLGFRVARDPN
jgi:formylglycine-generating enzyme required for sulfatase activity